MAQVEIENPLSGAILGHSFPANGEYDLTRYRKMYGDRSPLKIRCKLLRSGGLIATSTDYPPSGDITTDTGTWAVSFTVPAGGYNNCTIASLLVNSSGEHAQEVVTDITITDDGGGAVTVTVPPPPPPPQ
jgi:hypothetical protein